MKNCMVLLSFVCSHHIYINKLKPVQSRSRGAGLGHVRGEIRNRMLLPWALDNPRGVYRPMLFALHELAAALNKFQVPTLASRAYPYGIIIV
jgi:hypothetical protein